MRFKECLAWGLILALRQYRISFKWSRKFLTNENNQLKLSNDVISQAYILHLIWMKFGMEVLEKFGKIGSCPAPALLLCSCPLWAAIPKETMSYRTEGEFPSERTNERTNERTSIRPNVRPVPPDPSSPLPPLMFIRLKLEARLSKWAWRHKFSTAAC